MTSLLWAAFGMAVTAALLHGALGLRRPLDRTYLSFACLMVSLAAFLIFESELYRATTAEAAVEAVRRRVVAACLANASFFVFLPAYSKVRVPRLMRAYWFGLAFLFVANLVTPYGLWFSGRPEVETAVFRGELYTTVVAPPMSFLQYLYAAFFSSQIALGLGCAIAMFRHGERQRGVTFAVAVVAVGVHMVVDIVRDAVGGAWPYVTEYGFVTWGMIMSVRLALDYRAQADMIARAIVSVEAQAKQLTSILRALRALEQNMDIRLQTLQAGIATLSSATPNERDQDDRLRRAVTRLREFGRSMSTMSAWKQPSSRFG